MTEESILIISAEGDMRDNIALICAEYGFESVSVSDGSDARASVCAKKFDVVIVNTPLANEFGLELAVFTAEKTSSSVIILASQKNCAEIIKKIGSTEIYVLPKPLNRFSITQAFQFVLASRRKQRELQEENQRLEKKLHDIKQIDRAKCVLIQYLRISEEDAHRQIQKRAMDQRIPEIDVATDILRTYEM